MKVRNDPVTVIAEPKADATGEYREGAKVWRLKSGDLLVSVRKNSCGRRECSYLDVSMLKKGRVIYKG